MIEAPIQTNSKPGRNYFAIIFAFGAFFAGFFAFFAISSVLHRFFALARSAYGVQPRLLTLVYGQA